MSNTSSLEEQAYESGYIDGRAKEQRRIGQVIKELERHRDECAGFSDEEIYDSTIALIRGEK